MPNPNLIEFVSESGDELGGSRWQRRRSVAYREEVDQRTNSQLRSFGLGDFDPDDIMSIQLRRFPFDLLIGSNGVSDVSLRIQGRAVTFRLIVDAAAFA